MDKILLTPPAGMPADSLPSLGGAASDASGTSPGAFDRLARKADAFAFDVAAGDFERLAMNEADLSGDAGCVFASPARNEAADAFSGDPVGTFARLARKEPAVADEIAGASTGFARVARKEAADGAAASWSDAAAFAGS